MDFVNGASDFDMIVGLYVNQSVSTRVNRRGGRTKSKFTPTEKLSISFLRFLDSSAA